MKISPQGAWLNCGIDDFGFDMNKKYVHLSAFFVGVWLSWFVLYQQAFANPPLTEVSPLPPPLVWLSATIGALGSYLVFGDEKKFPPSATNVGHVLLGFGAGVFFSRGSLVLLGVDNMSHDVVLFSAFLWAVMGYFVLRLFVAVLTHDSIKDSVISLIPRWLARIFGGSK